MSRTHAELFARYEPEKALYGPALGLRVHRALSWLRRAEMEADAAGSPGEGDPDAQFIFLWIAFNAAYATDIAEDYFASEQETFRSFLDKLLTLDRDRRLPDLVWRQFTGPIRELLKNKYVFRDFWLSNKGTLAPDAWQPRFEAANRNARDALAANDTLKLLGIVLSRIYTLRNQLVHGGSTWHSSVNREQVRDCARFMAALVPVIIEIMMDNPQTLWGDAVYPVVSE